MSEELLIYWFAKMQNTEKLAKQNLEGSEEKSNYESLTQFSKEWHFDPIGQGSLGCQPQMCLHGTSVLLSKAIDPSPF